MTQNCCMTLKNCFLQIDPRYQPAWVDPQTLRFGFSSNQLEISGLADGDRAIISSLLNGVTLSHLQRTAIRCKLAPKDFRELMRLLSPVLISTPLDAQGEQRVFCGSSNTVRFATAHDNYSEKHLQSLQTALQQLGQTFAQKPQLLLTINRFLIDTDTSFQLFENDPTPQLPIIFTDSQVHIGPLLEHTKPVCAGCADNHLFAQDPQLTIMYPQLAQHQPATENPATVLHITPLLAQLIKHPESLKGVRYIFDFAGHTPAVPDRLPITASADCLCSMLRESPHRNIVTAGLQATTQKAAGAHEYRKRQSRKSA